MVSGIQPSPKVSVCVLTFNHAKFIRQCLQSFIDQETSFDFEVIVADDCSVDGTQEIVKEFAARYPGRVRAVLNEENLGGSLNFIQAHRLARGEYIAQMDGDDYALPGKLQSQSDFLDRHPEYNFVWHRMYVLDESTGEIAEDRVRPEDLPKNGFRRGDLLRYITIGPNGSKMYRAGLRNFEIPPFPLLDFFINVEQIGNGAAAFVGDKPLMVYRAGIGIGSRGSIVKELIKDCLLHFFAKYPDHGVQISSAAMGRLALAIMSGRWRDFRLYAGLVARVFRIGSIRDIMNHWKFFMMFRLP